MTIVRHPVIPPGARAPAQSGLSAVGRSGSRRIGRCVRPLRRTVGGDVTGREHL
ncbi:hypothetical protein [Azospirillum largimobile]